MLAEIGVTTTFLAFVAALYALGASLWGARTRSEGTVLSARNAVFLAFALLLTACVVLMIALVREDYQISYVWSVSNPSMPLFFRITALWGSQAGSLLFWSFLLSAFAAGAVWLNWHNNRRLMPYVIAYTMATLAFFLFLSIFIENPFNRYWFVGTETLETALIPAGGVAPGDALLRDSANGLNPLLRHFGMAIHPPMLYLGFVGFLVPFAFAMAALASGDLSTNWIRASRRWALAAWLFLSLGLILGGRWAYDVLGWGGYWGWDPVENAAFLPWLMGTAFLHSVMIQEKRGMLKTWNMFLVIGTFSAVIFGTFATRSGLVESVHSFARSEIGFPMFAFWFGMTIVSVWLILWRRNRGELRDEHAFANIFSRESLFVLNNLVFGALFIAIFWGSFGAPIVSELFLNSNITLGTEYFQRVTPPLFAALFILMGIAPLSAWGATSLRRLGMSALVPLILAVASLIVFALMGMAEPIALIGYGIICFSGWVAIYETYRALMARVRQHGENPLQAFFALLQRNPRRYGGYLIHLGVTVIGLGALGSTLFQQETQQTMSVGQSMEIAGYTIRYDGFAPNQVAEDGRIMDIATLTVLRDGQELQTLRPRRDFFPNVEGMNSMTIAASRSTLQDDVYTILVDWEQTPSAQAATFKVYINPLVNLIWWGGFVLIAGTLAATWSGDTLPARSRKSLMVGATA
ncbi:MAG: heme lyase CcmF/NrfE family subunit [Anaerolineae bacterium]|nr:heme lyase CcmF/NrfE family subunit [Anaerolineae bacterium]